MSILSKIKEANKQGKIFYITDPSEMVQTLPDGRTVLEIFTHGKFEDTNMKTSRFIGVARSEPAVLLKPLKFVERGGPKGGITKKGTYPVGAAIRIVGWPGFSDKDNCDLIVCQGDEEFPKAEVMKDISERIIGCKEGVYINLQEGVDYEYTGVAPMIATKTREEVITMRDIDYQDEMFCEGTLPAMTTVLLCTQFKETFLEFEGTRIMDDPIDGVDYA